MAVGRKSTSRWLYRLAATVLLTGIVILLTSRLIRGLGSVCAPFDAGSVCARFNAGIARLFCVPSVAVRSSGLRLDDLVGNLAGLEVPNFWHSVEHIAGNRAP